MLGTGLAAAGCSGEISTGLEGRLWVSGVPTSTKEPISALAFRKGDDPYGILFRGTVYRGTHDVARWHADARDRGTMTLLADGTTYRLRLEACKPTRGFDHCIVLHGGPGGRERFLSRKRWGLGKDTSTSDIKLLSAAVFDEWITDAGLDLADAPSEP